MLAWLHSKGGSVCNKKHKHGRSMWWKQNSSSCSIYADSKRSIIKLHVKKSIKWNISETPPERNSRGQKSCWGYPGACSGNEDDKILRLRRRSCPILVLQSKMARNWENAARKHKQDPYELNQVCLYQKQKVFHRGFLSSGSALGQTEQNRLLLGTMQEPHLPPAVIKVNSH